MEAAIGPSSAAELRCKDFSSLAHSSGFLSHSWFFLGFFFLLPLYLQIV